VQALARNLQVSKDPYADVCWRVLTYTTCEHVCAGTRTQSSGLQKQIPQI
jgi:cytochrome oxidase Cu insertion factor (SCO1/SenC/PrrC family)